MKVPDWKRFYNMSMWDVCIGLLTDRELFQTGPFTIACKYCREAFEPRWKPAAIRKPARWSAFCSRACWRAYHRERRENMDREEA